METSVETCADFAAKSGFVPTSGYQPKTAWLQVAILKEQKEKERAAREAAAAASAAAARTTAVMPTSTAVAGEVAVEDGSALRPSSRGAAGTGVRRGRSRCVGGGKGGDGGSGGSSGSDGKGSRSPSSHASSSSRRDVSPHGPMMRPVPLSLSSSSHSQASSSFPPASPGAAHTPLHSPMSPLAEGVAPSSSSLLPPAPLPVSPRSSSSPMSVHTASPTTSRSPLRGVGIAHSTAPATASPTPAASEGASPGSPTAAVEVCRSPAASRLGGSSPRVEAGTVRPSAPAPPAEPGKVVVVSAEEEEREQVWSPRRPSESGESKLRSPVDEQELESTYAAPVDKPSATASVTGGRDTAGTGTAAAAETDPCGPDENGHDSGDGQAGRQQQTDPPAAPTEAAAPSCPPEEPSRPPSPPPSPSVSPSPPPAPVRSPEQAAAAAVSGAAPPDDDDDDDDSSSDESEAEQEVSQSHGAGVDVTPERVRSPLTTPPPAERPARVRKAPAARKAARKGRRRKRERAPRSRVIAAGAAQAQAGLARQQRAAGAEVAAAAASAAAAVAAAAAAAAPSFLGTASTAADKKVSEDVAKLCSVNRVVAGPVLEMSGTDHLVVACLRSTIVSVENLHFQEAIFGRRKYRQRRGPRDCRPSCRPLCRRKHASQRTAVAQRYEPNRERANTDGRELSGVV